MERKGCCNRQRKNGKAERKIRRTIMGIGEGVKMGRMSKRHVKVHSFDAFVSRELLIQFFFFFFFCLALDALWWSTTLSSMVSILRIDGDDFSSATFYHEDSVQTLR